MIRASVWTIVNRLLICGVLAVSLLIAADGHGDKIILKDGSVELSDRIWESDQYVHFILKGTQGVEIRYAKEIVSRIERLKPDGDTSSQLPAVSVDATAIKVDEAEEQIVRQKAPVVSPGPVPTGNRPLEAYQRLAKENGGLLFYDPRRPMRYWAMRNSKHEELTSALGAMARHYDRTAEWVETHMGQENDLGRIHQNLAQRLFHEKADSRESVAPRPDKVNREMPLKEGAAKKRNEMVQPTRNRPSIPSQIDSGVRFYDPRRVEKYWSGQMTRHHTLKEALHALAQQYGVTPSWIESHMGDTNDLATIHRSIQKNINKNKLSGN